MALAPEGESSNATEVPIEKDMRARVRRSPAMILPLRICGNEFARGHYARTRAREYAPIEKRPARRESVSLRSRRQTNTCLTKQAYTPWTEPTRSLSKQAQHSSTLAQIGPKRADLGRSATNGGPDLPELERTWSKSALDRPKTVILGGAWPRFGRHQPHFGKIQQHLVVHSRNMAQVWPETLGVFGGYSIFLNTNTNVRKAPCSYSVGQRS